MSKEQQQPEKLPRKLSEQPQTPEQPAEQPQLAVALSYEAGDVAPQVTAQGRGEMARRIVALAKEQGIPLVQDQALAKALLHVPLNTTIPEELYPTVAAILAYLYRLERGGKR